MLLLRDAAKTRVAAQDLAGLLVGRQAFGDRHKLAFFEPAQMGRRSTQKLLVQTVARAIFLEFNGNFRVERPAPGAKGLDFIAADGRTHRIVLPFDTLSGLLMTLPRMLQSALNARFADGSLRVVQRLGAWQLEQLEGNDGLILKLGTTDGFEVAFALDGEHAGSLGAALLATPNDTDSTSQGRPH